MGWTSGCGLRPCWSGVGCLGAPSSTAGPGAEWPRARAVGHGWPRTGRGSGSVPPRPEAKAQGNKLGVCSDHKLWS